MYDLIIKPRSNKRKIIALIICLVILIIVSIISGIYINEDICTTNNGKQAQMMQVKIEQEEEEKRQKQEQEIKNRTAKTSAPLNENQINSILHVYNSTGEKRVFLTFDDGPSRLITPLILDILKAENVKATFFLLGENAQRNAELVKREFNEGHYIGNHGYTHKYSEVYSSPEATLAEYNTTEQIIKNILGNQQFRTNVFRFPGGSNGGFYDDKKQASKALLRQNGIAHLDWNALTEDAAGKYTKEQLFENAKNTIGNKDSVVILMHDASDKVLTYEMLPSLIHYLKEQQYSFKNIYDIL